MDTDYVAAMTAAARYNSMLNSVMDRQRVAYLTIAHHLHGKIPDAVGYHFVTIKALFGGIG